MSCSIFIRSYRTDRFWLQYCLRSLAKFAKGFDEIVVVIPEQDRAHFYGFDFHGAKDFWITEPTTCHPYLSQQITKIEADKFTESEWILFIDSDCFATKEFTPFGFGLPVKGIQLIRHWPDAGSGAIWKEPTQKALGIEPIFEHMAVMPLIYNRATLLLLREHIQNLHKKSLVDYISAIDGKTFSEFNLLGAFAIRHTPQFYDWRIANPENDGYCRVVKQHYSHDNIEKYKEEFERILSA